MKPAKLDFNRKYSKHHQAIDGNGDLFKLVYYGVYWAVGTVT